MNIEKCNKDEVNSALQHLINHARNTSNSKVKGVKSKPRPIDDNVTIDDITGFSIQYSYDYTNHILHIFTKDKSYVLKIDDDELPTWISILISMKDVTKPKFSIGDTVEPIKQKFSMDDLDDIEEDEEVVDTYGEE